MTKTELRAQVRELELENLRLRLLLLDTDTPCAHEWVVQSTSLCSHAYSPSTYHTHERCRICFAERRRQVTQAWDQAYSTWKTAIAQRASGSKQAGPP